jgi:hypothetical protein
MKMSGSLRCLTTVAVLMAACSNSPSSSDDIDPGKPASEFGTKCFVELLDDASNPVLGFEDCTLSAASTDQRSHVYLYFGRLPQGAQRMYVSFVLGVAPLAIGAHGNARAGSLEVTMHDGRTFSAGDIRKDGALAFAIENVAPSDSGDHYYVTGTLEATLHDLRNSSSTLRLRSWANRTRPPL